MERILLIEDEERIARVLQLELEHEGYEVQTAPDGREGLRAALAAPGWSLIMLDVMLPELSGLEVLRRIRQADAAVPVLLLTARCSVPDRVSGLDQGANDYVTKPFAIEELLARIRSLLRHRQPAAADNSAEAAAVLSVGDLTMELKNREVRRADVSIELTPTEFELLRFLIEHREEVMTREQIISDVWGYDYVGDTNVVDVYIRYLRQKIDKPFAAKLIHTLRGVGYMLKDGVEAEERGADDAAPGGGETKERGTGDEAPDGGETEERSKGDAATDGGETEERGKGGEAPGGAETEKRSKGDAATDGGETEERGKGDAATGGAETEKRSKGDAAPDGGETEERGTGDKAPAAAADEGADSRGAETAAGRL